MGGSSSSSSSSSPAARPPSMPAPTRRSAAEATGALSSPRERRRRSPSPEHAKSSPCVPTVGSRSGRQSSRASLHLRLRSPSPAEPQRRVSGLPTAASQRQELRGHVSHRDLPPAKTIAEHEAGGCLDFHAGGSALPCDTRARDGGTRHGRSRSCGPRLRILLESIICRAGSGEEERFGVWSSLAPSSSSLSSVLDLLLGAELSDIAERTPARRTPTARHLAPLPSQRRR